MTDDVSTNEDDNENDSDEFALVPISEDEQIIRWVALALIDGRKETAIRNEVNSMRISSQPSRQEWTSLIRCAREEAEGMRNFIMAKAEMGSVDYLRLDSYTRRKRMMARMEGLIESAVSQADSVSKMNSASFMLVDCSRLKSQWISSPAHRKPRLKFKSTSATTHSTNSEM